MGSDWKLKLAAFKISNPNFELDANYQNKLHKYMSKEKDAEKLKESETTARLRNAYTADYSGSNSETISQVGAHHREREIVFVHNDFIVAREVCDVLLGIIQFM